MLDGVVSAFCGVAGRLAAPPYPGLASSATMMSFHECTSTTPAIMATSVPPRHHVGRVYWNLRDYS